MNSTTNIMPFGSLTAKHLQTKKFEELDLNFDRIITEEEITKVFGKQIFDTLDLSSIDKDADKKVTQNEFDLWQQEAEMKDLTDSFKTQASRDLIGQDNDTILTVINKLEEFKNYFIQSYSQKDGILKMAAEFKKALPIKYTEIKQNALKNTKSAIKNRVIENLIEDVTNDSRKGGRTYLGLINNNNFTLSGNAKRLLGNELSKEADKFIKSYDGEELERTLTKHLVQFLQQTDRSKLAEYIGIWDNSKKDSAELSNKEAELRQLKESAKEFLLSALEAGVFVNLNNTNIRTTVAIPVALSQFRDAENLKEAIDSIIRNLSTITILDKIKYTQHAVIKENTEKPKIEEIKFNPLLQ